ncbi:hypothetical protein DAI22_04g017300 [Oryza sativa Japonica Group]|nr:hypothetical protein DAI22_04g017300 [Oryza sativa Japonica Group]
MAVVAAGLFLVRAKENRPNKTLLFGGPIFGGAVALLLVLWFLISWLMQKRIRHTFGKGTGGTRRFEYDDLAIATDNFSEDRKLGQGAFGVVYSGFLKRLNREVAVKKIFRKPSGENHKDFFAEVSIISEAKHKNLVKFFGWCCREYSWNIARFMCSCFSKKNKELFLVYELMKNGKLNDYLYKSQSAAVLSWQTRFPYLHIYYDIGSGLFYLHHECDPYILDRDIKPGNIVLDDNFNTKLADFVQDGKVSFNRSSDVYSFGIALLEVACARRHREQIWDLYRSGGDVVEAADSRLAIGGNGTERREMERVIMLGLWCSAFETKHRPSMRQAMDVLERDAPLPDLNLIVNSTLASTDQDASSSLVGNG